jgi:DNA repair protein RecO (recombination protein O)
MLLKVRGIVLHHINYSESSLILHLYTDQKGRMAIIVPGARGRRKNKKISLYHNLSLLELEVYYKDSRDLQQIREARPEIPMSGVTGDPVKSTIALFLAELLYRTLKEEESNPDLFSFLENSISFFEMTDDGTANFHLWFMLHLTRFLGFFPHDNHIDEGEWFNLRSGRFTTFPPEAGSRLEPRVSDTLAQFLRSGLQEAISIPLNRNQRNELLEGLLDFYRIHLQGMGEIKSYSVMQEIFT